MATKPAQKRHPSMGEPGPSTKRARFAAEGTQADDQAFSAQVDEELEPAGATRRGGIKTDGYDSDSSDDGEGVVESRKRALKKKKDKDDEDDDMFGGGDVKDDSDNDETKKKKQAKFMNLGDIEGQEFNRVGDGSDVDDDYEPVDEDDAERLKKKGMGYELSGFNMKSEMEEGKFAEDGTFIRSYDPHQVHDRWMDGFNDDAIKKARKSKKRMEELERERQQREDDDASLDKRKEHLQTELLDYVRPGETVLQTLTRLGQEKKKEEKDKPKSKTRSAKAPLMDIDTSANDKKPAANPTPIEKVTALASALMSLGDLHIYDETHRTLLFSVRESGIVSDDWVPPSAAPPPPPPDSLIEYQYRWSPSYLAAATGGAKETDVFGPFKKDELLSWKSANYFGEAGERIELRRLGGETWGGWEIVV